MSRPKQKLKKCPHCPRRGRQKRGVCEGCYQNGRNRVLSGQATDEELVKVGYWLPAGRKGGGGIGAKKLDALLSTATK